MNKKRTKLNSKQRKYLLRLRDAIKDEVALEEQNVGYESGSELHLRDTVRFLNKIISNDWYHKQSAVSIEMVIEEFHILIEKHGR